MGDMSTESRKLLEKITLEGKLHKLYRSEIQSEKDVDSWASSLTRSFDVTDRDVITNHKIYEIENTLKKEQEVLVNKLLKKLDRLEHEERQLQVKLNET